MRRCQVLVGCLLFFIQCLAGPVGAALPGDLVLAPLISGLNSPVAVRHAGDGSGRLFIVEQGGVIRIWDGAAMLPTPFLNITSAVLSGGERGLLGLAFHPDYANNGFFYVNYTYDFDPTGSVDDRTRIARYSVSAGNPDVADPGETVILEIDQDFSNHNGGDIHFGSDGYLYIGMGDGGSGGDPNNRAQDRTQLLGKMLRIDVDGPPRGVITGCGLVANYAIPLDNPFVGDGNACDEIWAYGVRNPWRFSFDRRTGAMFIGDVGQNMWEEIDLQPASSSGGENYGWRCYEGTHEYNTTGCTGPYIDPILEYQHLNGRNSITGGYAYRGHGIAGFDGTYMFADFGTGEIWFATPNGGWSATVWTDTGFGISAFGEDEDGEIYVADLFGGTVSRFESPSTIFVDGFESGDTSGW